MHPMHMQGSPFNGQPSAPASNGSSADRPPTQESIDARRVASMETRIPNMNPIEASPRVAAFSMVSPIHTPRTYSPTNKTTRVQTHNHALP
jgi:hypothetical protein